MNGILSIDLLWLSLALFFICFIAIVLIQGNVRFWLPCVFIWLALLFTWLIGSITAGNEVTYQEVLQAQGIVKVENPADTETAALKNARTQKQLLNSRLLNLLGIHTAISLFWLLLGYRRTMLSYYRKTAITFFILTLVYLGYLLLNNFIAQ